MDAGIGEGHEFIITVNMTVTEVAQFVSQKAPLLSDVAEFTFRIIFYVILSCCFSLFGIVANITNIVVFFRLGILSEGSNLNLFFLSVTDLGCVATNLLHSIGFSVILADIRDLRWDPFAVLYLAVGWPHTIFTLATRLLTAYVAFERCLCVMLPFRVKTLFTPRRSLIYILTFITYTIMSHVPIYLTHRLDFEKQEDTNSSKLVLTFAQDRDIIHDVVYYSNFFVVSFASVIIVLICTLITSSHIKTSKEWRKSVSHTVAAKPRIDKGNLDNQNSPSCNDLANIKPEHFKETKMTDATIDKETRLVKMITLISIIFLICYTPEFALIVLKTIDERVRTNGQYHRLAHLMYSITFVMTTLNSSINIFVYYRMSSKYQRQLKSWCCMTDKKSN